MASQLDGRSRAARRQADQARQLAVEGRWPEAAQLNREILTSFPRDVDALQRLGKALTELGQYDEALETYGVALGIEPQNPIAQRNVHKLEQLRAAVAAGSEAPARGRDEPVPLDAGVFVEEVGKTYITDLVRPVGDLLLTGVAPADELTLDITGHEVFVQDRDGQRLGQLEPKIARRLAEMTELGNRFTAYVVALTGNTIRIILREVYRNPDALMRISFPRQATIAAPRPYLRESRLTELEPDVLYDLEEDEELEEEAEETEAAGEEAEEEEPYVEEPEAADEEENPLAH